MSPKKNVALSNAPAKVEPLIHEIRGERVIMDSDLARIYGVPTVRLNEAVKRNSRRFPEDFAFYITLLEWQSMVEEATARKANDSKGSLISQFAISNNGRGGRRTLPRVFTEHGALMAANILRSARAEDMSVYVVRAFVSMRQTFRDRSEIDKRLNELEMKTKGHDSQIHGVIETLRKLVSPPPIPPKRQMGFQLQESNKPKARRRK